MKSKLSTIAILLVGLVYVSTSLMNFTHQEKIKVSTWDALGYYLYLPATFIYNDLDKLAFYPAIEAKYKLQGVDNEFYQFSHLENGNYTGKYFVGVAVMQAPFFLIAHGFTSISNHQLADGFSSPYQFAIIFSALFYLLLGLFILSNSLLHFHSDGIVAITIILLGLASNLIQYCAIDAGQSHVYLFFLYSCILYFTIKWHTLYSKKQAVLIGLCIGLATICRPTEIIIFFIPLLWFANDKIRWQEKVKKLFTQEKQFIYTAIGFAFIVLIQIAYWKISTGNYIYNVGSKWHFFNPHWRVLFGFEKGWFIYTPITIFFIAGLFFLKNSNYKTAIITYCILNVWIIIAWADWRYGGSYSTRALVQSYPIWALAFAAFVSWIDTKKFKTAFYLIGIYLIGLNLFQVYQYNTGILHYDKMNYEYYKKIYLNPNVTEEDKKLLSD